jgi:uracil-DNA glycosylase
MREEFNDLVSAFAEHLRWRDRSGTFGVPSAASPRSGVVLPQAEAAPDGAQAEGVVSLEQIRAEMGDCQRCKLGAGRTNLVFGVGSPNADLMFIGEGPGQDEDRQGEPFVGKAGQLLTKMIGAMGLERGDVYIANIVKCRPPNNRDPEADEIEACEPFLKAQIDSISPRIIIAMGNFAVKTLLGTTTGITRLRGNWRSYYNTPLMPTFHPAYLLRNAAGKRPAWNDLKAVMKEMDDQGLFRRR